MGGGSHRRHVLYAKAERIPVYLRCSLVIIAVGRRAAAAALTVDLLIRDAAEPTSDNLIPSIGENRGELTA